jgi:coat protein VP1
MSQQKRLRQQSCPPLKQGSSIDIQSLLSKIPFTTTGIPYEKHLIGHNFTGPGTRLDLRLKNDDTIHTDTPKEWSKPVNRVDEAAYVHDLRYRNAGDDLARKHEVDRIA